MAKWCQQLCQGNIGELHSQNSASVSSRRSSPQISQKDADFEIQIGEIGVICGSLLRFLVSFRHWGGFKATCLGGEKSAWDLPTHHFEVDGLLVVRPGNFGFSI